MNLKMHDLIWISYYLLSGIITFAVFNTHFLYILGFVAFFEVFYYFIYHKHYIFVKRFFFNIFYILGYIIGLVFFKDEL